MNVAGLGDLTRIKEALVVLIVSALFIVLASDLDIEVLARLSFPLLAVTAAVVFLVRPAAIMLVTIGSGMTWQERVLVSWIGPRGIVAAAVAGLASIKLSADAYPSSELLQPAVFAVITATVLLHGFTLRPLARSLGRAVPPCAVSFAEVAPPVWDVLTQCRARKRGGATGVAMLGPPGWNSRRRCCPRRKRASCRSSHTSTAPPAF